MLCASFIKILFYQYTTTRKARLYWHGLLHLPHSNTRNLQGHGRKRGRYDTSDYPTDHPLYSKKNAQLLGKMNDECSGQAPYEFVGLRTKMYYIRLPNNIAKFTANGIYFQTPTTCRLPTKATNNKDDDSGIYHFDQ